MSSILEQLGLASHEEKVYITLLALGQLTTGEISRHSGVDFFQSERALERLIERGLVQQVQGLSRFVALYPFEGFVEEAQKGVEVLASLGLDLESYVTVKVNELRRRIDEQKGSIANSMVSVRQEIEKTAAEGSGRLTQQAQTASTQIQTIKERALLKIMELTESYSIQERKLLEEMSTEIIQVTEQTEASVGDSMRTSADLLVKEIIDLTEIRQDQINQMETGIKSALKRFQTMGDFQSSHFSHEISTGFKKLTGSLEDLGKNLESAISQFLDNNIGLPETASDSISKEEGLDEQIGGLVSDSTHRSGIWPFKKKEMDLQQFKDLFLQLVGDTVSKQISEALTKFDSAMNETLSSGLEEVESIEGEFQRIANSLRETIANIVQDLESRSSEVNQEDIDRIQQIVNGLEKSIGEAGDQWANRLSIEFNTMRKEVETTLENLTSTAADSRNEYKSSASQVLETSTDSLVKTLGHVSNQASSVLQEAMSKFSERIEQTKQTFVSEFDQRMAMVEEVASALGEYSARFTENTRNVTKTISEHELLLQSLLDEVGKAESAVSIETAPIFGKESVIAFIHEMVVRTTSMITLLFPDPADVPLEALSNLKGYHRVVVVSDFDLKKHNHILRRLLARDATRVRNTSFSRVAAAGQDLVSYIAAERDNEEICVATVSAEGEIIGLASRSPAHISLLGRIVIGDFFLARSREIRKADLYTSDYSVEP
ncbi:MAG: helix-turn-helix domain-containing protein [Candidatus Heimdallarchaeota archaeon]